MSADSQNPGPLSDAQWCLRIQLADFYHLVDFFGWTELIFNHISARLPGPDHTYFVNPFGLTFSEITPQNLLTVKVAGELLGPSEHQANPAGFALDGAIHATRADLKSTPSPCRRWR